MISVCSLAEYAKIHADLAFGRDESGQRLSYEGVLSRHGLTLEAWRACEAYWTRRIGAPTILCEPNRDYDPALADEFHALMVAERDRLLGPAINDARYPTTARSA
jgi:hypothetical protein